MLHLKTKDRQAKNPDNAFLAKLFSCWFLVLDVAKMNNSKMTCMYVKCPLIFIHVLILLLLILLDGMREETAKRCCKGRITRCGEERQRAR